MDTATSRTAPVTMDLSGTVGALDVTGLDNRPSVGFTVGPAGRVTGLVDAVPEAVDAVPSAEVAVPSVDTAVPVADVAGPAVALAPSAYAVALSAVEPPLVARAVAVRAAPARTAPSSLTSAAGPFVSEPQVPDVPWRPEAWLHEAAIEKDRRMANPEAALAGLPMPPAPPIPAPDPSGAWNGSFEPVTSPRPPAPRRASLAESRRQGLGLHPAPPATVDASDTSGDASAGASTDGGTDSSTYAAVGPTEAPVDSPSGAPDGDGPFGGAASLMPDSFGDAEPVHSRDHGGSDPDATDLTATGSDGHGASDPGERGSPPADALTESSTFPGSASADTASEPGRLPGHAADAMAVTELPWPLGQDDVAEDDDPARPALRHRLPPDGVPLDHQGERPASPSTVDGDAGVRASDVAGPPAGSSADVSGGTADDLVSGVWCPDTKRHSRVSGSGPATGAGRGQDPTAGSGAASSVDAATSAGVPTVVGATPGFGPDARSVESRSAPTHADESRSTSRQDGPASAAGTTRPDHGNLAFPRSFGGPTTRPASSAGPSPSGPPQSPLPLAHPTHQPRTPAPPPGGTHGAPSQGLPGSSSGTDHASQELSPGAGPEGSPFGASHSTSAQASSHDGPAQGTSFGTSPSTFVQGTPDDGTAPGSSSGVSQDGTAHASGASHGTTAGGPPSGASVGPGAGTSAAQRLSVAWSERRSSAAAPGMPSHDSGSGLPPGAPLVHGPSAVLSVDRSPRADVVSDAGAFGGVPEDGRRRDVGERGTGTVGGQSPDGTVSGGVVAAQAPLFVGPPETVPASGIMADPAPPAGPAMVHLERRGPAAGSSVDAGTGSAGWADGSGSGSGTGAGSGSGPSSGPGSSSGAGDGAGSGTGSESASGAEPGIGSGLGLWSGSESGPGPGPGAGAGAGSGSGTGSGSDAGAAFRASTEWPGSGTGSDTEWPGSGTGSDGAASPHTSTGSSGGRAGGGSAAVFSGAGDGSAGADPGGGPSRRSAWPEDGASGSGDGSAGTGSGYEGHGSVSSAVGVDVGRSAPAVLFRPSSGMGADLPFGSAIDPTFDLVVRSADLPLLFADPLVHRGNAADVATSRGTVPSSGDPSTGWAADPGGHSRAEWQANPSAGWSADPPAHGPSGAWGFGPPTGSTAQVAGAEAAGSVTQVAGTGAVMSGSQAAGVVTTDGVGAQQLRPLRWSTDRYAPAGPGLVQLASGDAPTGRAWQRHREPAVETRVPGSVAGRVGRIHAIDVSDVTVRRGPAVSARARQLGARGFTEDGVVYLPDEAGPLGGGGRADALLAHELTHVAQQRRYGTALPPAGSPHGHRLETEARAVERWYEADEPGPPPERSDDGEVPAGLSGAGRVLDAWSFDGEAPGGLQLADDPFDADLDLASLFGPDDDAEAPGGASDVGGSTDLSRSTGLGGPNGLGGLTGPGDTDGLSGLGNLDGLGGPSGLGGLGGSSGLGGPNGLGGLGGLGLGGLAGATGLGGLDGIGGPGGLRALAELADFHVGPVAPDGTGQRPSLAEAMRALAAAAPLLTGANDDGRDDPSDPPVAADDDEEQESDDLAGRVDEVLSRRWLDLDDLTGVDELTARIGEDPPRRWMDLDASEDLEELATRLYDRLLDRLRFDVLVQRERSGTLMDFR